MTTTFAGTAGRITGTAARHIAHAWSLIDWAEVGTIVLHGLVALVVLTWHAGRLTGRACHRVNDQLAAFWRNLLVPMPTDTTPEPEPMADPIADVVEAVARLEALTCRELRELTGCRRKLAKRQLIAMALA